MRPDGHPRCPRGSTWIESSDSAWTWNALVSVSILRPGDVVLARLGMVQGDTQEESGPPLGKDGVKWPKGIPHPDVAVAPRRELDARLMPLCQAVRGRRVADFFVSVARFTKPEWEDLASFNFREGGLCQETSALRFRQQRQTSAARQNAGPSPESTYLRSPRVIQISDGGFVVGDRVVIVWCCGVRPFFIVVVTSMKYGGPLSLLARRRIRAI